MRGRSGWRRCRVEALPAIVIGLTSLGAGSGRHGGRRVSPITARAVGRALKVDAI
jgi:hypothetical protein